MWHYPLTLALKPSLISLLATYLLSAFGCNAHFYLPYPLILIGLFLLPSTSLSKLVAVVFITVYCDGLISGVCLCEALIKFLRPRRFQYAKISALSGLLLTPIYVQHALSPVCNFSMRSITGSMWPVLWRERHLQHNRSACLDLRVHVQTHCSICRVNNTKPLTHFCHLIT